MELESWGFVQGRGSSAGLEIVESNLVSLKIDRPWPVRSTPQAVESCPVRIQELFAGTGLVKHHSNGSRPWDSLETFSLRWSLDFSSATSPLSYSFYESVILRSWNFSSSRFLFFFSVFEASFQTFRFLSFKIFLYFLLFRSCKNETSNNKLVSHEIEIRRIYVIHIHNDNYYQQTTASQAIASIHSDREQSRKNRRLI